MKKVSVSSWIWFLVGLVIIVNSVFFFLIYPALPSLFDAHGNESLLAKLVNAVYPRFEVEKHRFPASFFIEKAEQVCIRFNLSVLMLALLFFIPKRFISVREKLDQWWNGNTTIANVNFLRITFFVAMFGFTFDWYTYLHEYEAAKAFYKPVLIFKVLYLPYPSPLVIKILWGVYFTSIIITVLDIRAWISSTVSVVLFTLFLGYLQSFEKINHGFSTFSYAAMLMPFVLVKPRRGDKTGSVDVWPVRLIQAAIVFTYFFAGLEKLLISGLDWLGGSSILHYAQVFSTEYGKAFELNHVLNPFMALGAIFLQLTFPLILFFRKLKMYYLPLGILFHFGTILSIGVGTFVNPWIFCYLFFFDWTGVVDKLSHWKDFNNVKRWFMSSRPRRWGK